MSAAFEVQHFTLCDGWTNFWRTEEAGGLSVRLSFPSHSAAQVALDEFLAEIEADIKRGERLPSEGYHADEFRIVATDTDDADRVGRIIA